MSIQPFALLQLLQLLQASKGKMFLPRLIIHYTSPLDEWQLIVTMATELSLIGRVDTKVRNKALLAPWGCRAFEQVSAMLLAGCPGKKDVKKDVKTLQTRN